MKNIRKLAILGVVIVALGAIVEQSKIVKISGSFYRSADTESQVSNPAMAKDGVSSETRLAPSAVVAKDEISSETAPVQETQNSEVPLRKSRFVNLSTRGYTNVRPEPDQIMIAGIVIRGGQKKLLVRHIGASLMDYGVVGYLHSFVDIRKPIGAGFDIYEKLDGNWVFKRWQWPQWDSISPSEGGGDIRSVMEEAFRSVGAFPLKPGSYDGAYILKTAIPKFDIASYSFHSTATGDQGLGISLFELYDMDGLDTIAKLINISTRGWIFLTDEQSIIVGLAIAGDTPFTFILRGVGPGLTQYGVPVVAPNPNMEIYWHRGGVNQLIAKNDDQGRFGPNDSVPPVPGIVIEQVTASDFLKVGAFPLPAGSRDSALKITVSPGIWGNGAGVFSAVVRGGGVVGEILVEAYDFNP